MSSEVGGRLDGVETIAAGVAGAAGGVLGGSPAGRFEGACVPNAGLCTGFEVGRGVATARGIDAGGVVIGFGVESEDDEGGVDEGGVDVGGVDAGGVDVGDGEDGRGDDVVRRAGVAVWVPVTSPVFVLGFGVPRRSR